MLDRIGRISSKIAGNKSDRYSDDMFMDIKQGEYPAKIVKNLFVKLFRYSININDKTEQHMKETYKLKETVNFQLDSKLVQNGNLSFFSSDVLKELEIHNYSIFMSVLYDLLKTGQTNFENQVCLNEKDRKTFKDRT